jgi:alkyl sulfatase BDS1-like metallo-beta-lactamase superfamily hydrolase
MSKSAKEMFDVHLPNGLKANPDKAKGIGAVFCFKVSGPNGGSWTVDLKADPPSVKPEASATAQCTVSIADADFEALLGNPKLGMPFFTQGKLKVAGNQMLAMKLEQLFKLAAAT